MTLLYSNYFFIFRQLKDSQTFKIIYKTCDIKKKMADFYHEYSKEDNKYIGYGGMQENRYIPRYSPKPYYTQIIFLFLDN
jgi:hypothetical protein